MSLVREPEFSPPNSPAASFVVNVVTGNELPERLLQQVASLEGIGPFARSAWWSSWWKNLRPRGSELYIVTVQQADRLVGLAPWYRQPVLGLGKVVRYLGDGRACSDYASIAALPEKRADVWNAISGWVATEAGRSWDAMILEGVSAADTEQHAFYKQLSQRGVLVDQRAVANTWRVALPETWDEYVALFSKQHRNRLRRAKRDLFDSGRLVLRRVTNAADLEKGFEIQRRLHQLRRQSLGDAGCFADDRFEKFVREANAAFLVDQSLRLQWTECDGEVIAFDSGYVQHDGVFVYQTAFDPSKSELSPGRLHFQASLLKAIEEGYRYFDFLRGDEPYKAHFHAEPIPVLETRLIGPRVASRLSHRVWTFQKQVKSRVRQFLDARKSPNGEPGALATGAESHSTAESNTTTAPNSTT